MLSLELIEDSRELLGLAAEWSCFLERLPEVTPFQLPDWLLTWWSHFGSGQLQTFVFRNGNEIAAILPCFRHEWNGKRQLTLIGSGISDYLEPGIAHAHSADVLQMLKERLKQDHSWDVCSWQDLNANTPLQALASCDEFAAHVEPDAECAETHLYGGFEQYWKDRPHGLRRNLRRYLEKARTIDDPEFRVTAEADPELIDALVALHAARWREHGEPGMIVRNHSALFLRDIAARFATRDMLRFFSLRFAGRIVSVIASFRYRNVLFSYLSAFDPEYETLGFGRSLLYYALQHAFDMHYESWNFLRGNEPYKFEWGARSIPKCRITLTRGA